MKKSSAFIILLNLLSFNGFSQLNVGFNATEYSEMLTLADVQYHKKDTVIPRYMVISLSDANSTPPAG